MNYLERLVLRCGWTVQRLHPDYGIDLFMEVSHQEATKSCVSLHPDYGIDLFMETFDSRGGIENGEVKFQLKATDTLPALARKQAIPVRLEWRDVLFWLNEPMPVILVVYDAANDRAWWVFLQESLRRSGRGRGGRTFVTVHVPLGNVLNEAAIRQFARFRDAALAPKGRSSP